jgi:ribonuclease P protein component
MVGYGRLKNRGEFGKVIKHGRTVGDRNLVLFILSSSDSEAKVGFTAQRKAGNAVKRNRIKRRLRALHKHFEPDLIPCGHLIWLGKTGVLQADWDGLVKSGRKLLTRAGCLAKDFG